MVLSRRIASLRRGLVARAPHGTGGISKSPVTPRSFKNVRSRLPTLHDLVGSIKGYREQPTLEGPNMHDLLIRNELVTDGTEGLHAEPKRTMPA